MGRAENGTGSDHDFEFVDFEGEIPAGKYGSGHVETWDRGNYQCEGWAEDEISLSFSGHRLHGPCNLIRFPRGGGKAWLIFRLTK